MAKRIDDGGGPSYPELGTGVAKYRKLIREGLAALSKAERQAYGDAIEKAIRAKQRSELQRELPTHRVSCASGTDHNTGEAIHKAILAQHRARTQAWPGQIRRARTDAEWREMYEQAMSEKNSQPIISKKRRAA
jgi:hypothetical protein